MTGTEHFAVGFLAALVAIYVVKKVRFIFVQIGRAGGLKYLGTHINGLVAFKIACENAVTEKELLNLLKEKIELFERNNLDTEDAENVASKFESILDCVGLESSGGVLNNWMYGFDV